MKHGLEWYKHEPRAFIDGVQGMGPELIGAYIVLLDLIYARGDETMRDDRHLAGILGCSIRKATSLTDSLIEQNKIQFEGGYLSNSRAKRDVKSARNSYETRSKSQSVRRENEAELNENNDLKDKPETSAFIRKDKNRIDEKPTCFSGRASARKPNGFVHVRKSTDAARSLIQELQENEQFGEDRGDEILDQAVRKFPTIAHVGS
ncbi:DUF1376 domain-containing protein [Phyllobacterium zundukense]|uniref:DUF1376 domain-containing protein n=1 Tax=Phyllobacterium zundukense TaxID=1867719 RepID=A0A2N9VW27_9HYPH|nr:DUF1376 domain-containing protein [Phyllobacterium zundukense]ATU91428.1 hypothetical protein BLM14_07125 [Phyllobacterium zundukense]PIO43695.1 hypothetical protein B5P45_17510 [Phyllobacterium zundukense]